MYHVKLHKCHGIAPSNGVYVYPSVETAVEALAIAREHAEYVCSEMHKGVFHLAGVAITSGPSTVGKPAHVLKADLRAKLAALKHDELFVSKRNKRMYLLKTPVASQTKKQIQALDIYIQRAESKIARLKARVNKPIGKSKVIRFIITGYTKQPEAAVLTPTAFFHT